MLNDLVYMLQNKLTTTDLLYENVINLFDSKKYNVAQLFSELSRISAIATFANVHDSGITSAFTDRTSELIAEYRASVPPFSLCSLLESGYDDAQIQLPGFITSYDYQQNDDKNRNVDKSENVITSFPKDVVESTDSVKFRTDVLDVSKLSSTDDKAFKDDEVMHNGDSILVAEDIRDSTCSTNRQDYERFNCEKDSSVHSTLVRAKLVDESLYDPENPDKYEDDYAEIRKHSVDHNYTEFAVNNKPPIIFHDEMAISENGTPFFAKKTESEVQVASYYNSMHRKKNDPFQPDDYYAIPDLCYAMCDKHKNVSVYDIANYITHLPLSNKSTMTQNSIKKLMTMSPLSIKSRVIHVPSPPAILSSFIKVYESDNFKNAYIDCYNIRLLTKFPDRELKFSQQHFRALRENFKSYIGNTDNFGMSFQFLDMTTQQETAANSNRICDDKSYKYVHLVVFTTYHSYVFDKITAMLFTKYDKMSAKSIMAS